jgi:ATP-dependent helicase HrpA
MKKKFSNKYQQSESRYQLADTEIQRRLQLIPQEIHFPDLPINQKRDDIAQLIANNSVVILAGETGSGKTTQIPKICLTLGRGVRGLIGHTQPRRIAAHTVANRIAEELQTTLGDKVGCQVRFSDQTTENTLIKVMTDGILLAEIQNDPLLNRYDTLIIDEAHERSLNIDFLLGYIKKILPKRPDLKVIITSATIDLQRFSQHFNNAPIIEVSGRTYPVDVWYRPPYLSEKYDSERKENEEQEYDQYQAILDAVHEIQLFEKERKETNLGGDILVFLSGERDIREAADVLRKAQIPHLDIVPFYARLSLAEQQKVFAPHKGRRIVLATNVAETSITVPGIHYVIDPGFARISRYSYKTKIQRLPIEAISQASANQRKGRCGRIADGICIRLYAEDDFNSRPEYTDAEIVRTNLASVILHMLHLGIGDIHRFPFIDAPDHRLISDGFKLLEELQAINSKQQLTALGKQLAKLPLDPRLGRMLLAAQERGCVREVLTIVSALSVQDPRERPHEKQQAADQMHSRFRVENSDFLAFIKLWDYAETQRQALSQNQWRKLCKKEFLSYLRLREWKEVHHQLSITTKDLGFKINTEAANDEAIHRAMLTGLLGNLGFNHEQREYLGARQKKFTIFPGSSLNKKTPKWLMAAELIETSKLFAHTVAKIEPEWVIAAANHLLKRQYVEPHYNSRSGQVMAYEKATLYGLVIVEKKAVSYNHIDATQARDVFIRAALVQGQYDMHPSRKQLMKNSQQDFFIHQQKLLTELEELESKSRRRDILVEEQVIFDFYNERIPADVVNFSGFEAWRKTVEKENPKILFILRETLMRHAAIDITQAQFPNQLEWQGTVFPLTYHFEPKHSLDGVSIHVPVSLLDQLSEKRLEWLVPGMLRDKCVNLIKGLPKQWRKHFVPVPDMVDKVLNEIVGRDATSCVSTLSLTEVLAQQLKRITGIMLPAVAWQEIIIDDFYRFNICVIDDCGKILSSGRDLTVLREEYRTQVKKTIQAAATQIERENMITWDFGHLPETVQLPRAGVSVRGYPALVDKYSSVSLQVLDKADYALSVTQRGLARLLYLSLAPQTIKYVQKDLLKGQDVLLSFAEIGNREQVMDDIILAALKQLAVPNQTQLPRTQEIFNDLLIQVKDQLYPTTRELTQYLETSLKLLLDIKKELKQSQNLLNLAFTVDSIRQQLTRLFYSGMVYQTPALWLQQYPRYLRAMQSRIEKAKQYPQKDRAFSEEIKPHWQRLEDYLKKEGAYKLEQDAALMDYRWWIEEFYVSTFAQSLKTLVSVSDKRLNKQWELVTLQK